ncbi:TlpA disulfide reductase family protein [Flavobacterium sp. DG1-102-2]|uniref:TlpA family protein disulfide reductase n=1 Tax=Flavobacterium sp. DG1-102-2 TaxID=3081663 RepID=UPI0029493563|nr:TlpA disulfide reductase family protein [Flavobacterium sp. DG1-102-2]MDV6167997.1 TlpA disulfide reductase family protein [Flavobacterium sp. DG1-102-2]
MRNLLHLILFLLFSSTAISQAADDTLYFSNAIKINFAQYKKESTLAFALGDLERGEFLFDSLVQNRLVGTTFDNISLKKSSGPRLRLSSVKKPLFLLTYASWCVPNQGEIPAINKLARQYGKDVKIVVLFWDRKDKMKKIARKFSGRITICYAHEYYKTDARIVAALKHTLGFPTSYFLDANRKIVDIRRCGVFKTLEKQQYQKSFDLNYNSYLEGLSTIMIKNPDADDDTK